MLHVADEIHLQRATTTLEAICTPELFSRHTHLWGRRRWWLRRTNETLWPYADAWSALCTLAGLPGQTRARALLAGRVDGLAKYHRRHRAALRGTGPIGFESSAVFPHGRGGDVYYDDNAWLGLALDRQHNVTGAVDAAPLSRRLLAFVVSGWSEVPSWSHPGGIRWKVPTSNRSRNACSNGPAAELAALLHLRDGDPTSLGWAVRIYAWTYDALRGSDHLYLDQIAPDGTLRSEIWSYNQGSMIGAGVLLHEATGHRDYLTQAETTAQASVRRFSVDRLLAQDAAFNAVFFRNLLLLDHVVPNPAYRSLAEDYAQAMWVERRDPRTGLFSGGDSFLNNSAPMIQIYALLAGSPPHA